MKKIVAILIMIIYAHNMLSQSIYLESIKGNKSNNTHDESELLNIHPSSIYASLANQPSQVIYLHTEQSCFRLALIQTFIVSNQCIRNYNSYKPVHPIKTFKVINLEYPNHTTALTISNDFLCLSIYNGDNIITVESMQSIDSLALKNEYFLHSENDQLNSNLRCGVRAEQNSRQLIDHDSENNSALAQCIIIDIALACDRTVFNKQGGVFNAEAFMINVLNQVQANYDDEFPTSIEFNITSFFVADLATNDPWNAVNNIDEHLAVFRSWANGGGFGGASYSVATAWTIKYSGTYGLAYVGSLCSSERYNVCSDFSFGIGLLRGLLAHELGHNFNCNHDSGGSPFIMAPGINSSVKWSTSSISAVENYIKTIGCYGICSSDRTPIADFTVSRNEICPYQSVVFKDLSFGNPTMWEWKFPGGNPAQSKLQNPIVNYPNGGTYSASLKVSNPFGQDEITKNDIIKVEYSPISKFDALVLDDLLLTKNVSENYLVSQWEFGDGKTSNEEEPQHQYLKDGDYQLKLCVSNSCTTNCKIKYITIITKLKVDYELIQSRPCVPATVQLINKSNATKYQWTLDGPEKLSSTNSNPRFNIIKSGKYKLTLNAYKLNDSLTKTWYQELEFKSAVRCPEYGR